jgi:hypothetical protein
MRIGGPRRMSRRAALRRGALRLRIEGAATASRLEIVARNAAGRAVAVRRLRVPAGAARWVHVPLTDAGERWLRGRTVARLRVAAGARAVRSNILR